MLSVVDLSSMWMFSVFCEFTLSVLDSSNAFTVWCSRWRDGYISEMPAQGESVKIWELTDTPRCFLLCVSLAIHLRRKFANELCLLLKGTSFVRDSIVRRWLHAGHALQCRYMRSGVFPASLSQEQYWYYFICTKNSTIRSYHIWHRCCKNMLMTSMLPGTEVSQSVTWTI